MEDIYPYAVVIIAQLLMSFLDVLKIRYSYQDEATKLALVTLVTVSTWLYSTSIGLFAIINGNWGLAIAYVLSAVVGKYLAVTFFPNNMRNRIYNKLFDKNKKSGKK